MRPRTGRHSCAARVPRWRWPAVAAVAASLLIIGAVATPALAEVATGALAEGTPCTVTARACVDLHEGAAWLLRDGKILRGPVRIVDGDKEEPTPTGTFAVEWKAEHWVSRESGVPMPYSVFFAPGGIAFHQGNLHRASAGCVKLGLDDAVAWFAELQVGDQVQVVRPPAPQSSHRS